MIDCITSSKNRRHAHPIPDYKGALGTQEHSSYKQGSTDSPLIRGSQKEKKKEKKPDIPSLSGRFPHLYDTSTKHNLLMFVNMAPLRGIYTAQHIMRHLGFEHDVIRLLHALERDGVGMNGNTSYMLL